MLFNSVAFFIFLLIVFALYWVATSKKLKWQNLLLLVASYYFYACWDWRFLFLLIFSTLLDYFTGIKMASAKDHSQKKLWFWISICINLGFLAVFKYYNFFAQSFTEAVSHVGVTVSPWTLSVILPVGISFYTFHGLSYVIDIYNNRIKPERNFIDYSLFVSFFPLLVAGPIERATHLLPQIKVRRKFDYNLGMQGLYQILWGLFKKMVIADNSAKLVNILFSDPHYTGSSLVMGAFFFAFQIYGDFSGYSDIAIGVAKLLGFNLITNFSFPYFSRDIAEFWRRWHISLTTWFRDYVYIPLGGSRGTFWQNVRNTFIVFLISGFWHGANWTFIVWGFLNALYFLPLLLLNQNRKNLNTVSTNRFLPSFKEFFQIILTFCLTTFAWIFFRSKDLTSAFDYINRMFSKTLLSVPKLKTGIDNTNMCLTLVFIVLMVLIEWVNRRNVFVFERMHKAKIYLQLAAVIFFTVMLFLFTGDQQNFIYFQF
jgi:alginate O-acetyltransferase complex protein AlgI